MDLLQQAAAQDPDILQKALGMYQPAAQTQLQAQAQAQPGIAGNFDENDMPTNQMGAHPHQLQGPVVAPRSTEADVKAEIEKQKHLAVIHARMQKLQADHDAAMEKERLNAGKLVVPKHVDVQPGTVHPIVNFAIPADDPYAKLRGSQVAPGYVDPLQAQIQAENAAKTQGSPVTPEADSANLQAFAQQQAKEEQQGQAEALNRDQYQQPPPPPAQQAAPPPPPDDGQQQGQGQPPPPVTPPTYIPGGYARTVSPDVLAQRGQFEQGRDESLAQNEIDARLANQKQAEFYAQRTAELQAQRDQQQQELQRQQQAHAKAQTDWEHANKEAEAAKIDPEKAYGGGWGRLIAGIASGLGAFGASLTHSHNFAQQSINEWINTSMEAQKAEVASKHKTADNMYSRLLAATGDERAADNAFKLAGLQVAESQANELGAGVRDTALMDGLRAAKSQVQQDNMMFRMATERGYPGQYVGGTGNAGSGAEIDDKHRYIELPTDFEGHREGTRYVVPKEEFPKIAASTAAYGTAMKELDRMDGVFKDHGVEAYVPGSKASNEVQSAINNVVENYSRVGGIDRAPSKAMVNHFREQLETSWYNMGLGAGGEDRTAAARAGLKNVYGGMLHTYAPSEGKPTLTATPQGYQPGTEYTPEIARRHPAPQGFSTPAWLEQAQHPTHPVLPYRPAIKVETKPAVKGTKGHPGHGEETEEVDAGDGDEE